MNLAEQGISALLQHVDSLIVIPNERLKLISAEKITLKNAFEAADNVLKQGVESISNLINVPSFINLDFADIRSVMKDAGYAHMGIGTGKGSGKAENAAKAAISSPLLETDINGAHGVIINITASQDIGLDEVDEVATLITKNAHPEANIIWGTAFEETLNDELRVTVVATGFDSPKAGAAAGKAGTSPLPSPVFSEEQTSSEPAPAEKDAKTESGKDDEDYFDSLLKMLNKNNGR